MKDRILQALLVLTLLSQFPLFAFAQPWPFFGPYRLTTGVNDRNASFENNVYSVNFRRFEFEFLIFERHSGMSSNICVSKIKYDGSNDSAFNLTNNQFRNLNPSVSYFYENIYPASPVKHAMAVWQSDRSGRWGIFGAVYNHISGWSETICIDTSAADNIKPKICCFDSSNYGITYQSGYDIKYARYCVDSQSIEYEINLTITDTLKCGNPFLNYSNGPVIVSYERMLSIERSAVYFRVGTRDFMPPELNPSDTIAFTGNNRNEGFAIFNWKKCGQFASNRSGSYSVYAREILPAGLQDFVIRPDQFDNFNYTGTNFEITDQSGFTNHTSAYLRKSVLSRIFFSYFDTEPVFSVLVSSNSAFEAKVAKNASLIVPDLPCQRFWFVFNANALEPGIQSAIYGYYVDNCLIGIGQSGATDNRISLSLQNFPNPFNSETRINYSISKSGHVKLNVYDVLGRLVYTAADEFMTQGSYETSLDAGSLSGGVYFCRLSAEGLSETIRLVLIK